MSSNCFCGKVAIITGASSGIGFCTAVHFAKLGAKLVITGRNESRLNEAKKECEAGSAEANVVCVVGDITDANVQKTLVQTALDYFGAIHILVNNAGISIPSGICGDSGAIEKFDLLFHVNVRSVIELCRLSAPHLIKSKGNIVNISSKTALKPVAYCSYYGMSKAALDMFTKVLAQELAPQGVRVNSVNPSTVDTPLVSNFMELKGLTVTPEQIKLMLAKLHPLGRGGESQDVANAIAFLASDESDWITGSILKVDGGNLIRADSLLPSLNK